MGIKTNNEIAGDIFKIIFEDMGMKSLIFNIDEIKNKMDAESKGPY
jgi:dynein heavy chain